MNLISIYIDTLRYDFKELINGKNFMRLKKMSHNFINVYSETLPTIPVRRSMITGKRFFPFEKNIKEYGYYTPCLGWYPIDDKDISMPELFRKKGYKTCLITDNSMYFTKGMNYRQKYDEYIYFAGQEMSYQPTKNWLSVDIKNMSPKYKYSDYEGSLLKMFLYHNRYRTSDYYVKNIFDSAEKWLEINKNNNFYLHLDIFDLHQPYVKNKYTKKNKKYVMYPLNGNWKQNLMTSNEAKSVRDLYIGELEQLDEYFGYFLDYLKENHILDDTILFLISDHGILLGEHNMFNKPDYALYPEVMKLVCSLYIPRTGTCVYDNLLFNIDFTNYLIHRFGLDDRPYVDVFLYDRVYITSKFHYTEFAYNDHYYYWIDKNKKEYLFDIDDFDTDLASDKKYDNVKKYMLGLIKNDY